MRLVSLTKDGNDTGFAVSPADFETGLAPDGDGKTWHDAGYRLGHYEDTREPYVKPRQPARVETPPAVKPKE